jgi:hypothetical protein
MRPWTMALTALVLSLALLSGAVSEQDVRDRLENVARAQDPDFPDGGTAKLTHFSYVCHLLTDDGPIYVANRRAVSNLPREAQGRNALVFVDGQFRLLASVPYERSFPLWCDEGKLYLEGAWDGQQFEFEPCQDERGCNVIDWSRGYGKLPDFRWERADGSSIAAVGRRR